MTEKEKQEIITVVKSYGQKRHEMEISVLEIQRKQREREIPVYTGEIQIGELYKMLEKTHEREKFVEMTKNLDDDEFEKHFRSACLKEFLNINIAPEDL